MTANIVCFGGLITEFLKHVEGLDSTALVNPATARMALDRFRRLKKGLEPLLFIIFSIFTLILTVMSYFFLSKIIATQEKFDLTSILNYFIHITNAGLMLAYSSVMADDAFSALKDILTPLE